MNRKISIQCCAECQRRTHYNERWQIDNHYHCFAMDRRIIDVESASEIPGWCPLPEDNEAELLATLRLFIDAVPNDDDGIPPWADCGFHTWYCRECAEDAEEWADIDHAADCPVTRARAAIARAEGKE